MNKTLLILPALLFTTPVYAGNSYSDHSNLWNAVQTAGITIIVNDPRYCSSNPGGGAYISLKRQLHVCQENGIFQGVQARYTTEDLNTIRHEAHHLVQDCIDGSLNGSLQPLFRTEDELVNFLSRSSLTEQDLKNIAKAYKEQGANERTIILEWEAFAVAEDIPASSIQTAVEKYCM